MNVGTAQIDITPETGAELSGFSLRTQPHTGVLDRLQARALYLVDGAQPLLWIHCDLIGFDAGIVAAFRQWAQRDLGLSPSQVMLSATHTHSGPCTIRLAEAGAYDERYVEFLQIQLQRAAHQAMRRTEACTVVAAEGRLELAVHRRNPASAHTDPRVGVVGFQRADATFVAAIANYPVHPVALGHENRHLSADLFGPAAEELSRQLPGLPLVLMTNGACGNLNPPAEGVTCEQVAAWGREIAKAVTPRLQTVPTPLSSSLQTAVMKCALPLDVLDRAGIDSYAEKLLAGVTGGSPEWQAKLGRAVEQWRRSLTSAIDGGRVVHQREVEVFVVRIGEVIFVGAAAELFSEFTDWVRRDTGLRVYTVGYANGDWGYLTTRAAYAEGGYEVETAHIFYGHYRFKAGGLELLAEKTAALLRREFARSPNPADLENRARD